MKYELRKWISNKYNSFQYRVLMIFFSVLMPVMMVIFIITAANEVSFYNNYINETGHFFADVIENSISDSLYFKEYFRIGDIFDKTVMNSDYTSCRIYDRRGILIANSNNDISEFNFAPEQEGLDVLNSSENYVTENSDNYIFSRKVVLGNQVLGAIVIDFSRKHINSGIRKILSVLLIADIIIFIAGTLLFSRFAKSISRPIMKLSEAVRSYRNRNFDLEFEYNGISEIGDFSRALRDMAAELKGNFIELKKSDERFNLAVSGANTGIWDYQPETGQLYMSPRMKEIFFISPDTELESIDEWFERIIEFDRDKIKKAFNDYISGETDEFKTDYRIKDLDGGFKWVSTTGKGLFDDKNVCTRIAGSLTDISSQKESEEELIKAALYDPLTKLPNRALLLERLKNAVDINKRNHDWHFALLYLDYDGFKGVNDTYGHVVGDLLLKSIAERLLDCVRDQDLVCRIGGDEFVILLEDCDCWKDVVERVQHVSESEFVVNNYSIFLSASIGVASDDVDFLTIEDLVQYSDVAMYKAKKEKKGSYTVYRKDMHLQIRNKWQLEYELHKAPGNNELYLVYQPIVEMYDRRIGECESLLRWNHSSKGFVSPSDFLPLAEDSGFITSITDWVLDELTNMLSKAEYFDTGIRFAVNISSKDFIENPDIYSRLERFIKHFPSLSKRLDIEVTETSLMSNFEKCKRQLHGIRELGIRVKLDDFGTGFSSMSYLHNFPLDSIKIDRSFIMTLPEDKDNLSILRHLINLSHDLGYNVIAEGVETDDQHEILKDLGCDKGQGFLYSRPVNFSRFRQLLSGVNQKAI